MSTLDAIGKPQASGPARSGEATLGPGAELTTMAFWMWAIVGLFLDGHSHAIGNPETFFSPAHGLLYSGFAAGAIWTGSVAVREAKIRPPRHLSYAPDRFVLWGFGLFALGGLSDLVWHETLGFETGLEPSLSAPHLMLMVGGVLVAGGPLRSSLHFKREVSVPAALSLMLSATIPFFFLAPVSPFTYPLYHEVLDGPNDERIIRGVMSTVIATLLLVGVALIARRQWRLPYGAITAMVVPIAVAMSGMRGFDTWLPIVGVVAAGLVGDECVRRNVGPSLMAGLMSAVLWSLYFIAYEIQRDVVWPVTVWTGAIVWPTIAAVAAGLLVHTRLGSPSEVDA